MFRPNSLDSDFCLGAHAYTQAVNGEDFRRVFAEFRKASGLSQRALAARTEGNPFAVSGQAVSDIEAGATENPGLQTVAVLVEAMGVSLSGFFLQIECQTEPDSTKSSGVGKNPLAAPTSAVDWTPQVGLDLPVSSVAKVISDALAGAAAAIAKAATPQTAREDGPARTGDRRKKPGARRRRA